MRRTAWITLGLCGLAGLCEGFDLQSAAVAAPMIAREFNLPPAAFGGVLSAALIGVFLGALAGGRWGDQRGRRPVLVWSVAFFGVFTLASAFAADVAGLKALRFLAGLGLGAALANLTPLAAEQLAPRRRRSIVTLMGASLPVGVGLAGLAARSLDWRPIFQIGGWAPLVVAALLATLLPQENRSEAAKDTLGFSPTLFGEARGLTSLVLWLASFALQLVVYAELSWGPLLLSARGVSKAEIGLYILTNGLGGAIGGVALSPLMDSRAARGFLVLWLAGYLASLAALAWADPRGNALIALGLTLGVFKATQVTLHGLAPPLYPRAGRARGVGVNVAVGRLGALAGPLIGGALLAAGVGGSSLIACIGIPAIVGGVAVFTVAARPRADTLEVA